MTFPTVFCVQDETGTSTQLSILPSPSPAVGPVAVGDVGLYEGYPDDGVANPAPTFQTVPFVVTAVLEDGYQFSVRAQNANMSDWPANGFITWQTGENVLEQSYVTGIDGANAYITPEEFAKYHNARGNSVPVGKTTADIRAAIVKSTDYLDQRYRYSGVKLLENMSNAASAFATAGLLYQSWLTPYALVSSNYPVATTSNQTTQWPRQGVVDNNGNTVNGIPRAIKEACSELAIRVLNGTDLQPDFDPNLVGNGGIVKSVMKKVGPLETSITYDTVQGVGFFATFPQVSRMLSKAGILYAGGGRTTVR